MSFAVYWRFDCGELDDEKCFGVERRGNFQLGIRE